MSTKKSEHVDRLIREHLTLNENLHEQSKHNGENATLAEGQSASGASTARVTEIRQELVQILQTPSDRS